MEKTVRVLLFASLREELGWHEREIKHIPGLRIKDLLHNLLPSTKTFQIASSILVAKNQQYVDEEAEIFPNDEIALIPPVSGG